MTTTTTTAATITAVATDAAPAAVGAYSQAVRAGDLLFVSGQLGLDPATGALVPGGAVAQARQALRNVLAVLAAAGAGAGDVVRTGVMLADIDDFAEVNAAYAEVFDGPVPPARAAYGVAALPKGGAVEIEAVAVLPAVRG